MYKWSNIEYESEDIEIGKINEMEKSLSPLPKNIIQIRELITRLEICHFKYRNHIKHIKKSIIELKPYILPEKIGACHLRNGEAKSCNEKTGRSLIGQKYLWALNKWLDSHFHTQNIMYDVEFNEHVFNYLGEKNPLKEDLVAMLAARLRWDWKTLKEISYTQHQSELEAQISRIDICHYTFPENLKQVLTAIGNNQAEENFKGCGFYNDDIKNDIIKEFLEVCQILKDVTDTEKNESEKTYRIWLIASLLKTLKEQINLELDITELLIL